MGRKLLRTGHWLALLALSATAAHAANPRITLKLDNVTPIEAAAALEKASGVQVTVAETAFVTGREKAAADHPRLAQRHSFNWNEVPLSEALREFARRFDLRPLTSYASRQGYTFWLASAPDAPPQRVGVFRGKNGVEVAVLATRASFSANQRLDGRDEVEGGHSLSLEVRCALGAGDGDLVVGFTDVIARDDLGNVLRGRDFFQGMPPPWHRGTWPDEWSGQIQFPNFHPQARKLTWIEGRLTGYRKSREFRVEFPLPLQEGAKKRTVDEVTFEIESFREQPGPPDGVGAAAASKSYSLRAHAYGPGRPAGEPGPDLANGIPSRPREQPQPVLVGASGRTYPANSQSTSGGAGQNGLRFRWSHEFGNVPEPVTAIRFRVVEKQEPAELVSFRITDIPLPRLTMFTGVKVPDRPRPGAATPAGVALPGRPAAPANPAGSRPFYAAGGGVLSTRVRISGKPVTEGSLSLGLAATGSGVGATRWLDVPVDATGEARLENVRPGTYRLYRVYHSARPRALDAAGRWTGGEVEATVTAGQELQLPLLEWVGGLAPMKPLSNSRPPVPKQRGSGAPPGTPRR